MGDLVDYVFARVLAEIEGQEDIAETESHRLNELCKLLHGLEALFKQGETVRMYIASQCWGTDASAVSGQPLRPAVFQVCIPV